MGELTTLTGLLKKAASDFPNRRAISAFGRFNLTHEQLQEHVNHAAALLAASGIGASDVVMLGFPNTVEFVILFLAVIRCRATAALLSLSYTAKEFESYLSVSGSKLLLTPQEGSPPAHSAASKLNIPHLTAKLHSANSKITLSSTRIKPNLALMSKVVNDPSDVALLLHPSGITSGPKGKRLTQLNLASAVQFTKSEYKLTESDSTVIVRPLFHVYGLVHELLSPLAAGAAVALPVVTAIAWLSVSRYWVNIVAQVRYRPTDACPCLRNDMLEGNNAPKTTEENKTKTERGGEEGGHSVKLTEEFEKLSGPKKFSYEESMIATDSLARDRILGGGFGNNVACVCSEVACPYQSNDMPEGSNAPKTTEENKTETERGGEEGGHSVKLTKEFEKLSGPKKFSYEELMIATADGKILGKGGFGIVYEGYIGDAHTQVAVKIINSYSRQGLEEYKSEVMTLSQLRHKNLVRLLGYCHEANKFVLVYKFIGGGSLDDHLFKGRPLLTWERRYNIALGLASSLHYLHNQCHQCVIHRDIKSSNVMLDEEFEAKLGDFGMAKLVDHTKDPNTTQVKGTPGYLSPEYFRTGKASKESDIYSFGVVLLEIVCGRRVFDPELVEQGLGLVQWVWKRCAYESWWGRRFWNFLLPMDERLGKDFNKKQVEALMILGLWCAHPIASSRPSVEEVMAVLNSTAKPPKLPLKMPSFNI